MAEPAVMVEVLRGSLVESLHRGHAVVCDARGGIRAAWGDPGAMIYPRSSSKMLQALPLVESGTPGLDEERLALACSSHQGATMHVSRVGTWLAEMGLRPDDLCCGPQIPDDPAERGRMREGFEPPDAIHNNCSGKHAGFLALTRHLGADPDYIRIDHPVQQAVRTAFEEMTDAPSPGWGIDGCSAPNFATTVSGLARAMARMADPTGLGAARGSAARRLVAAMIAHPLLVAGEGLACSELMAATGGRVAVKTGAEAVFVAILPEQGLGVALKIEDGTMRAAECAIAAILARLGVLDPRHPAVARRVTPPVLSRRNEHAGEIRPAPGFWKDGRAI